MATLQESQDCLQLEGNRRKGSDRLAGLSDATSVRDLKTL